MNKKYFLFALFICSAPFQLLLKGKEQDKKNVHTTIRIGQYSLAREDILAFKHKRNPNNFK